MVMIPATVRREIDCAGEGQQQLYMTDTSSRHRGCHKGYNRKCSVDKKLLAVSLKEPDTKTNQLADSWA
jgi:hypothetical protein